MGNIRRLYSFTCPANHISAGDSLSRPTLSVQNVQPYY